MVKNPVKIKKYKKFISLTDKCNEMTRKTVEINMPPKPANCKVQRPALSTMIVETTVIKTLTNMTPMVAKRASSNDNLAKTVFTGISLTAFMPDNCCESIIITAKVKAQRKSLSLNISEKVTCIKKEEFTVQEKRIGPQIIRAQTRFETQKIGDQNRNGHHQLVSAAQQTAILFTPINAEQKYIQISLVEIRGSQIRGVQTVLILHLPQLTPIKNRPNQKNEQNFSSQTNLPKWSATAPLANPPIMAPNGNKPPTQLQMKVNLSLSDSNKVSKNNLSDIFLPVGSSGVAFNDL
uniref:Uncharacterized protein n=1 Tax=Romanomermis culicivorax TaxID=13658 RepID=A0A915IV77_ROMCU